MKDSERLTDQIVASLAIEGLMMSTTERSRLLACAQGTLDTEEQIQKLVRHYTRNNQKLTG